MSDDTHDPEAPPPLTLEDAQAAPTWRAAYSDRTAVLMAKISQLAYVPFQNQAKPPAAGGQKPEKDGGREELAALLAGGGFELKQVFNWNYVQAFLAVNPEELAVLAFRGTANSEDWGINLDALRMPLPGYRNVWVHSGFWTAFQAQRKEIEKALATHVPPGLGLYITGHSLGGALAQIASAALERDTLAACYTFGSPRVGTVKFDREVKCPHYRLVNHWDLVPGVPPPTPWGYQHSGDPRLLVGHLPEEALRRDRNILAWLWAQLKALVQMPFRGGLFSIDDHMIWNYRNYLETVADSRSAMAKRRLASGHVADPTPRPPPPAAPTAPAPAEAPVTV
jgi:hypothetical protein